MVDLNIKLSESFLQDEERDGYLVTKEKKELWAVQLDLLNKLDQVCRKYNLNYIIDYGTLLGAVRHKGFIPWDMDIDVSMPRADFEELKRIAVTEFKEPYFLQDFDTDSSIDFAIARLRRSDTTFFHTGSVMFDFKYNQGIFLDIFPFDNLPSTDQNVLEPIDRKIKLMLHHAEMSARKPLIKIGNRYIIFMLQYLCYRLRYGSSAKQFKRLDDYAKSFKFSGYYRCQVAGGLKFRPKQWLEETVDLPFENLLLKAPKAYDEVLKDYFGDYMTPFIFEYTVPYFSASRCYKDVLKDKAFCQELFKKTFPSFSLGQLIGSLWIALKSKIH